MANDATADGPGTRQRILAAASELARTPDAGPVSVRTVATRAGVGLGTLRHHFPTQRALHDAVLASIYEDAMPDDAIHDTTRPASDRLLENLRRVIAPVGTGMQARETWARVHRAYIDPDASSAAREAYLALSREAHRRVESWLSILTREGALEDGDNAARARVLLTLLNGLAVQRALPSDRTALETENEVLHAAVQQLAAQGRRSA